MTIKLSTVWWSNAQGGSGIDFWFAVVESVVLITVDFVVAVAGRCFVPGKEPSCHLPKID